MASLSQSLSGTDALIIVDVQNDFCPGGAIPVPNGDEVVPKINELMNLFDHIALSQDWHPDGHLSFASSHEGRNPLDVVQMSYGEQILWPDHAVVGTKGAEFHPELATDKAHAVIRKGYRKEIDSYSTFFENDRTTPTGLSGFLDRCGVKRLFLTGLAIEYCVGFSALDAVTEGFEAYLVQDAVGSFRNEDSEPMRNRLANAGVRTIQSSELQSDG
ncbi:MAG: bifunctional nicotinamidase/pyrazinamidase [Rhodobacteraceae bacterium]|nr:bifunctional nicotinamidase/pyrazinamidase [Paracoccaceae bacterium]